MLERKSMRLKSMEYRSENAYFVTICLEDRIDRFGLVDPNGVLHVNDAGRMVIDAWYEIPIQFQTTATEDFVVMPNHLHGIVIVGPEAEAGLPAVMDWFKTVTTKRYGVGVRKHSWPNYLGKLWQRSYYDHVVRDEKDHERCRDYISSNPHRWAERLASRVGEA